MLKCNAKQEPSFLLPLNLEIQAPESRGSQVGMNCTDGLLEKNLPSDFEHLCWQHSQSTQVTAGEYTYFALFKCKKKSV